MQSDKKNILHISRTMGQGGAEKVVYQLASEMSADFKTICVASVGGELINNTHDTKFKHYQIYDIENKNPIFIYKNLKILKKIIKENDIDIVHMHHRMAAFYGQLLKRKFSKVKFIYTAHNIFPDKQSFYKLVLNGYEVIAVGKDVKKNLLEIGIEDKRISIITNSVKLNEETLKYNSNLFNSDYTNIVCVARLSEQKGIKYLIESMAKVSLKHSKIKLYLIGEGEDFDYLKDLVKKFNLNKVVNFVGYKKNAIEYIIESDFVVLPSLWEGLPLVPIETFMAEKTIIATNIQGTKEIVNNENGFLVSPKNPQEMAEKINYLIDNPDVRIKKEKKAKDNYLQNFSFDIFLNKHKKIYFRT